jgi:hypothetical protein
MEHVIEGNTYAVKDKLLELGCQWSLATRKWIAPNDEIAQQAQEIVNRGSARHHIPDAPYSMNRQLREAGCKWDVEKHQWFHTDPEKAREARRLVAANMEKGRERGGAQFATSHAIQSAAKEISHEM